MPSHSSPKTSSGGPCFLGPFLARTYRFRWTSNLIQSSSMNQLATAISTRAYFTLLSLFLLYRQTDSLLCVPLLLLHQSLAIMVRWLVRRVANLVVGRWERRGISVGRGVVVASAQKRVDPIEIGKGERYMGPSLPGPVSGWEGIQDGLSVDDGGGKDGMSESHRVRLCGGDRGRGPEGNTPAVDERLIVVVAEGMDGSVAKHRLYCLEKTLNHQLP